MADTIRVDGFKEFRKAVRAADSSLPKLVRVVNNECADLVVGRAKPKIPHRSGAAASSPRPGSTGTKVRVRAGSRKVPYYAWLDFGGRVGKSGSVHRPFKKKGRYLYATHDEIKAEDGYRAIMMDGLVGLGRKAGMEVERG